MSAPKPTPVLTAAERDRLYASFVPVASGCWEWTGSLGTLGYSRFLIRRKYYTGHRVLFETTVRTQGECREVTSTGGECLHIVVAELADRAEERLREVTGDE